MIDMHDATGAQSVDRALRLLSLVGRSSDKGMALNEIVDAGGYNKTTTRRLLVALMRARLVEHDQDTRRYYIGEEAYILGTFASPRFGLLNVSRQSLIRIARESGDACFVSIRRDTHSICLHREDGTFPIRSHFLQKGSEYPLGIGAGSLAMLAYLDDDEVEQMLADNAVEIARDFSGVSLADIRKGVSAARVNGYALNPGLVYESAWGLGVAIAYPDGRLAGALSIAAIDSRMQPPRQRELASILLEEANRVETKLARVLDHERKPARSGVRGNGGPQSRLRKA